MTSQVTKHSSRTGAKTSQPPVLRGVSKKLRRSPVKATVERHTDLVVSLTRSPSGSEQSPRTVRVVQRDRQGSDHSTGSSGRMPSYLSSIVDTQ